MALDICSLCFRWGFSRAFHIHLFLCCNGLYFYFGISSIHLFRCKILWFSLVDGNCFGDWIFMFPTLKPSLCKQLRLRLATLLSVGILSDLNAFHRSTENSLCPYHTWYSSLAVSIVCPGLSPGIWRGT